MKQGSASIKKIQNGKLLIAAVKLEIDNSEESEIEFATNGKPQFAKGSIEEMPSSGYDSWRNGAIQGANYALSVLRYPYPLYIKINEIQAIPSETTPRTIGIVTAMAIFSALGEEFPEASCEAIEKLIPIDRNVVIFRFV